MGKRNSLALKALTLVLLTCSVLFAQARILSLGGNPYIKDRSNVFRNPAKLSTYKNSLYGESKARIFASVGIGDVMDLGLICPQERAHTFIYDNAQTESPGANNLHVGLSFGSFGLEFFTEAKSNLDITTTSDNTKIDKSESIRSLDFKAGFCASIIDATINGGYVIEEDLSGSSGTDAADNMKDKITGSGPGGGIDAALLLGDENRFGGYLRAGAEMFEEKQKKTEIIGGTPQPIVETKLPSIRNIFILAGILSEIEIVKKLKLYSLLGVGMNQSFSKMNADAIAAVNGVEETAISYILPEIRAGIEHNIGKVWKIEKVRIRAGASKVTVSPTKTTTKTTDVTTDPTTSTVTTTDMRTAGNPGKVAWTLGVGMKQGNFSLDAAVAPEYLNGVYFLNGAGPTMKSITLSYKFKGGSSSSSSSGSEGSFDSTPPYTPQF